MRVYGTRDESNIYLERQIREWTQSGLLDPLQGANLLSEVRVDFRRTNIYLRVVLFIFSFLISAAAVALVAASSHLDDQTAGILCVMSGIATFFVAEVLVREFHFYRFGVEEGFAVLSAIFIPFGIGIAAGLTFFGHSSNTPMVFGIIAGILVSLALYLRFGYLYLAAFVLVGLGLWAFQIAATEAGKIALAATLLLAAAIIARILRKNCGRDYLAEEFGAIETLAFTGAYLILNLHLRIGHEGYSTLIKQQLSAAFYWFTYAAVWILPVLGFVVSLREKHRLMILASLGMALATLSTNKPYLGHERQTWDLIFFGLFLIAVAIAIKRWLTSGPGGYRYGYTASRLLYGDKQILTALGTAAAALHGTNVVSPSHAASPNSLHTGGGSSGGAGASGEF